MTICAMYIKQSSGKGEKRRKEENDMRENRNN